MPESQYTINAGISVGSQNPSFATWNSSTALSTVALLVANDISFNTLNVSLAQTSTITGGQVTFQGSLDGVNFFNMQGFIPPTGAAVPAVYTLQANTYSVFQFNLTGIPYFQILLSTAITGTGAVTIGYAADSFVSSLSSTTVTGTVAVTQSTSPWVVDVTQWANVAVGAPSAYGTSPGAVTVMGVNAFVTNIPAVSQSGTWTVQQGTPPWVVDGALTNNNAAPTATLIGVLPAIAETAYATVTYTTGDMVLPVTDLHGALNSDLQAVAGTALGTPQTFGTAPTGVVIGTSSDIYVAGTRARSNQTTTAAGVLDVNIVGSLGVTNSVTNGTFIAITDNTTKVGVIVATTALKTDMSSVAGTATVTGTGVSGAGIQRVTVSNDSSVSLGTSTGKTVVMKTGTLVTTAVTANQVVLTYTVTAGKTFYLQYVKICSQLTSTPGNANPIALGTVSLESPAGTKLYSILQMYGAIQWDFQDFAEPLPIAAGTVLRIVTTPVTATSTLWLGNFGGYEK